MVRKLIRGDQQHGIREPLEGGVDDALEGARNPRLRGDARVVEGYLEGLLLCQLAHLLEERPPVTGAVEQAGEMHDGRIEGHPIMAGTGDKAEAPGRQP